MSRYDGLNWKKRLDELPDRIKALNVRVDQNRTADRELVDTLQGRVAYLERVVQGFVDGNPGTLPYVVVGEEPNVNVNEYRRDGTVKRHGRFELRLDADSYVASALAKASDDTGQIVNPNYRQPVSAGYEFSYPMLTPSWAQQ